MGWTRIDTVSVSAYACCVCKKAPGGDELVFFVWFLCVVMKLRFVLAFLIFLPPFVEPVFCPGNGTILTDPSGIITSGSRQDAVPEQEQTCSWIIRPNQSASVDLYFSDLFINFDNGKRVMVYTCFDLGCTLASILPLRPYTVSPTSNSSDIINRRFTSYTGIMKLVYVIASYDDLNEIPSRFTAKYASGSFKPSFCSLGQYNSSSGCRQCSNKPLIDNAVYTNVGGIDDSYCTWDCSNDQEKIDGACIAPCSPGGTQYILNEYGCDEYGYMQRHAVKGVDIVAGVVGVILLPSILVALIAMRKQDAVAGQAVAALRAAHTQAAMLLAAAVLAVALAADISCSLRKAGLIRAAVVLHFVLAFLLHGSRFLRSLGRVNCTCRLGRACECKKLAAGQDRARQAEAAAAFFWLAASAIFIYALVVLVFSSGYYIDTFYKYTDEQYCITVRVRTGEREGEREGGRKREGGRESSTAS